MTATSTTSRRGSSPLGRATRSRSVRTIAAAAAVGVAATAIVTAGGPAAGASTLPQAQSVGNFLDATLGGNTLDAVAALKYASAKSPGAQSVQNPLDATLLGQATVPLTGALQLPQFGGITLGAVNQVAVAHADGYSYGASGAVNNSGGASVGGNNNAFPADATIDLTPSAIPGAGSAPALGGVTAKVGAVSALAQTPAGYGKEGKTNYSIASLKLTIGSPLLSGLLTQLTKALDPATVTTAVTTALANVPGAPTLSDPALSGCTLTSGSLPDLTVANGAVTISAAGSISIDVQALLSSLGLDVNGLPANTDLLAYLLAYLADPKGLAAGIEGVLASVTSALTTQFTHCTTALNGLGLPLTTAVDAVTTGQTSLNNAVNGLVGTAAGSTGTGNPLAPLASALQKLIDIGANVQPNGPAGPLKAAYVDPLAKTPKQGTPVVPDQTIVRAIEVNVAAASGAGLPGLPSIPGLGSLPGLPSSIPGVGSIPLPNGLSAGSGATGILTTALANAAAGPSTAPAAVATTTAPPTRSVAPTAIPTGVPAGLGTHGGGSPVLPLVLILLGLSAAGGGVLAYRLRGRYNP